MKPETETSIELMQQIMRRVIRRSGTSLDISQETRFIDDLGMNSIELLSFVVVCEREFAVSLMGRSDLFTRMVSVGDTLNYIEQIKKDASSVPAAAASLRQ